MLRQHSVSAALVDVTMSQEVRDTAAGGIPPFLKWAGGKRWFSEHHREKLPTDFATYYEPFLGSGAVYFRLQPAKAVLSDVNADLIATYRSLKANWRRVSDLLAWHHKKHENVHYYRIRRRRYKDPYYRAARFIYLNRTCWNGLYRVNSEGVFNVPIGTKTQVVLDSDCLENVAALLRTAELEVCDFEETINRATKNDLIFADPPYTALHKYNGFLKYNEKIFSWSDQIRLCNALQRAKGRGAKIVLTNADHASTRELFSSLGTVHTLERFSIIAANSKDRRRSNEILVCA